MTMFPNSPPDPEETDDADLFDWLDARVEELHERRQTGASTASTGSVKSLKRLLHCLEGLEQLADAAQGPRRNSTSMAGRDTPSTQSSDSMLRTLPRDLGPYRLETEVGRGGMGIVFKAMHRSLNSPVAVKVIRSSEWASEDQVRRFLREARAASRLRHPHIVAVHDVAECEGLHYLAMQWVEGEDLSQRLKRGPLTPAELAELMISVCRAVHYLHIQGIIHRDLKPANILLDKNGTPFVTDFGLAKVHDLDESRATTSMIVGTPSYMSPEQAWGTPEDLSPRSDVYSLGCILYELLSGRVPFPEKNPLDVLLRLRDSDPLPPRLVRRNTPPELELIVLTCLEQEPARRYASAAELADDLERFLQREPLSVRPSHWGRRLIRWTRSEPALASRAVAILTMALIVQTASWLSAAHRPQYLPEMLILGAWMASSVVLQKLMNRYQTSDSVRIAWVAADVVCFTAALVWAEAPRESLVIGYALMIVTSALWWRPWLIWTVTGANIAAYVWLIATYGSSDTPPHYPFIVTVVLLVMGIVMAGLIDYLLSVVRRRATK